MKNSVLYYAYGSNLNFNQMKQRCPSAIFAAIARLPGYRLTFPRMADSWGGGVAGIELDSTSSILGAIYKLSFDDLLILDKYEGVSNRDYIRVSLIVYLQNSSSQEVWSYLANPEKDNPFRPSRLYMETIIAGAKYHCLPHEYIEHLKRIPTTDQK